MADVNIENMPDIPIEKNSKIIVNVDESLPDILVVTYEYGSKIYQGVLLDSTKRHLPYGVSNLHPAYSNQKADSEDRLYSTSQRFAYQDGVATTKDYAPAQKRSVRLPARYKNTKMTVRLRPRQVLCSKCRGICNENSENVDASRKRKSNEEADEETNQPTQLQQSQQQQQQQQQKRTCTLVTRTSKPLISDSQNNEQQQQQQKMLLRLPPLPIRNNIPESSPLSVPECEPRVQPEFKEPPARREGKLDKKMVLRKKRSVVGSMEDLWDESVFEESGGGGVALEGDGSHPELSHSTRTIKISFGREGEGTVLKIPAKIEDLDTPESDEATQKTKNKDSSAKAARRALKKAKKEARRKILLGSGGSPCYALGNGSPRYNLTGNGSPRYSLTSPRHGLGGNSPRYAITTTTANYENLVPRRHKHKVKHKKKHREDRKSQRDPVDSSSELSIEASVPPPDDSSYIEIKERCLKQKLSISLKRLNASAYTRCDNNGVDEPKSGSECSDEPNENENENENAPDFPPPSQPLMMHITAQAVASGLSADGRRLAVGDVVWGKILGFPWWPGKVLSITETDQKTGPQAHVAWYGSSTSSLMPCDQLSPFLENFKIRYNKKKRGPYKEAIKQATCEARIESPPPPPPLLLPPQRSPSDLVSAPSPPPPPSSIVQPTLASPREIDVFS